MSENASAADQEFFAAMADMAGTVAQLVASRASREGVPIDHGAYVEAAMGMVGSAYQLAKLGGDDALRGYLELLRSHADAVEDAVSGA